MGLHVLAWVGPKAQRPLGDSPRLLVLTHSKRYEPLPSVFPGPRPRWPPPNLNLVSFTSTFASILTNITGKFADNLGIGLHVI